MRLKKCSKSTCFSAEHKHHVYLCELSFSGTVFGLIDCLWACLSTMSCNYECDRFAQVEENTRHHHRGNEKMVKSRLITVIIVFWVCFHNEDFTGVCLTEQLHVSSSEVTIMDSVIHYFSQINPKLMLRIRMSASVNAGSLNWLTSSDDPLDGDERDVNLLGKFVHRLVGIFIGEGVNVGTHPRELNCRGKCMMPLPFRCHSKMLVASESCLQSPMHAYKTSKCFYILLRNI